MFRKFFLASTLLLLATTGFCQNTMLTKGETVAYIQKKLDETISHLYANQSTYKMIKTTSNINGCKFQYFREMHSYLVRPETSEISYKSQFTEYNQTYTFDPQHIKSLEEVKPATGTLHALRIGLIGKTGMHSYYSFSYNKKTRRTRHWDWTNGEWFSSEDYYYFERNDTEEESVEYVYVYYLGTDPTNFGKLKRAFEHLRDLCKAEDDPFAN